MKIHLVGSTFIIYYDFIDGHKIVSRGCVKVATRYNPDQTKMSKSWLLYICFNDLQSFHLSVILGVHTVVYPEPCPALVLSCFVNAQFYCPFNQNTSIYWKKYTIWWSISCHRKLRSSKILKLWKMSFTFINWCLVSLIIL